jgi:hypothetical protein
MRQVNTHGTATFSAKSLPSKIKVFGTPDYGYQKTIANKAIKIIRKRNKLLIGAACGAGKNSIMALLIEKFIKQHGSKARVVVVCENLNNLKDQFLGYLKNPHYPVSFTLGDFNDSSDVQVKVGIVASLDKISFCSVQLLIVDECHRYYSASTIQNFIIRVKPVKQVLFTGSPSCFIDKEPHLPILTISGEELVSKNIYSSCDLFVTKTANKKNSQAVINAFLAQATAVGANLSKTLIVCPNIKFAEAVNDILSARGFKTFLSTSKNDSNNSILSVARSSPNGFLISVGKCTLGFNDESIKTLLDCRSTDSPTSLDNSNQIYARILRRATDGSRKSYFRISNADSESYNNQVLMLYRLKALMSTSIFSRFNGTNLKLETDHG